MYPEVEQYIKTRDAANEKNRADTIALNLKYSNLYNRPESEIDAYHSAKRETNTTFRVTVNEAWNGLTASSDPLVCFIAENCKEYQQQAAEVLKALPATVGQLDDLAGGHDWCEIWNQFRDEAVDRGLFGEVKPLSIARQRLRDYLVRDYGMSRAYLSKVNALVDAIVAEEAVSA